MTKKKRHIGVSLVFAALLQVLLGLFIVYGSITLYSFNLVFFTLVFPANSLEQTLAIVLGALFFSSGLMMASLSKILLTIFLMQEQRHGIARNINREIVPFSKAWFPSFFLMRLENS